MTDDQKKLAAIIPEMLQRATAEIRFEIEKELDERGLDEESLKAIETFYAMDNQFDRFLKRYGFAIARRCDAVATGNLIDGLTGTTS